MKEYLVLDNNEVEKIGTGRLISIIDKGFHTHIGQVADIVMGVIPSIVQIIFSIFFIFFIFFINTIYGLLFLFLLVSVCLLIYLQQNKANILSGSYYSVFDYLAKP